MHYAVEDLCAGLACHWGGGKETRMTCHSSGRIVTVTVYVSWDAEMLPPLRIWRSTDSAFFAALEYHADVFEP